MFMKQPLIALDQFLNTLTYARGEGFGRADETLSARAWRLRRRTATWGRFRRLLDARCLFGADHCRLSYEAEQQRYQLPPEYSAETVSPYVRR